MLRLLLVFLAALGVSFLGSSIINATFDFSMWPAHARTMTVVVPVCLTIFSLFLG